GHLARVGHRSEAVGHDREQRTSVYVPDDTGRVLAGLAVEGVCRATDRGGPDHQPPVARVPAPVIDNVVPAAFAFGGDRQLGLDSGMATLRRQEEPAALADERPWVELDPRRGGRSGVCGSARSLLARYSPAGPGIRSVGLRRGLRVGVADLGGTRDG